MNNAITVVAALALAIGTSFVVAQTTPSQPAHPTNTPPNQTPPPTDTPMAPRSNMPTSGAQMTPSAMPPDFSTLDKNGAGFVTQTDIATNPWMSKNFSMCDADHNGQVTRAEYSTCTKHP
jgi:hypothetical protein